MKSCRSTPFVVLLMMASLLGSSALSQQPKKTADEVVKISAELVQVDVLVLDKSNKPVKGLNREDFELYDNNHLEQITHFTLEEGRAQVAEGDRPSLPRIIAPSDLNRVIAFVIDTLHMKAENVYRTRKMLEEFIETRMAPGDLVLIVPTSGGSGLYQQFSSDRRVLLGAAGRLRPAFILDSDTPARRSGTSQQVLELLPALAESRQGIPQAAGQGGTGAGSNIVSLLEEADVHATLSALNTITMAMGRYPGRKIGVFVSEGFRAFQTRMSQELSETIARAARANVVFYSIDSGGLEPLGVVASDERLDLTRGPVATDPLSPSGTVLQSHRIDENNIAGDRRRDYFESQDALNALAVDTGGRFYRNSNDIKVGLNRMLEENSAYYLLGFQPGPGKWDGKFHKIKVAVRGRPDLVVITRKGYLARAEKAAERGPLTAKAAELLEAINSPLVRRDIDLLLTPFYRDDSRRDPVMTSTLHIDADKLTFKQVDGKQKTRLEVAGFTLDGAGRALESFNKTFDLSLEPDVYQNVLKNGLLTIRTTNIKPGVYQVKVLVREQQSLLIGTANAYVEIPDFKSDQLALSSIFTDGRLLNQEKAGEVTGVDGAMSQRRFLRNGQLAYVLIVYNGKSDGKETKLEIATRVLSRGRGVFAGQFKPVEVLEGSNPPARIVTGGVIQLSGLAPGEYILEVTVVDKLRKKEGSLARQEIDFYVD